ncbi:MAG: hypothetical protein GY714_10445 [Desulfobacterales bacterium]|nr:hypothetical protein [Desulfobacterales bacterium]
MEYPEEVQKEIDKGTEILKLTGEEDDIYYFKKPKTVDINRYLGTVAKGKLANAEKNLIYELALKPTTTEIQAEFKKMPGRLVALGNSLKTAVGINEDFSVKKL